MFIYLLKGDGGFYKIGIAQDVESRLRSFQTLPYNITLVHSCEIASDPHVEIKLHRLFGGKRVKGEWFSLNDEEVNRCMNIMSDPSQLKEVDWYAAPFDDRLSSLFKTIDIDSLYGLFGVTGGEIIYTRADDVIVKRPFPLLPGNYLIIRINETPTRAGTPLIGKFSFNKK